VIVSIQRDILIKRLIFVVIYIERYAEAVKLIHVSADVAIVKNLLGLLSC
jgi:hypothetical protein